MFRTDEPLYGHKWLYSFKVINERHIALQEYLLLLPTTAMKIWTLDMWKGGYMKGLPFPSKMVYNSVKS